MDMDKVLDKRRKDGTFAKGHKPENGFTDGHTPWNKQNLLDFKCLNCRTQKQIPYSQKHRMFCSRRCKSQYIATYNTNVVKTRFKSKPVEECVYKGSEKEYKRNWYLENKERMLKLSKQRYQKNKHRYTKRNKRWQAENWEKVQWIKRNYKIRKRNAEGSHTVEEWMILKKKCNYTCLKCKKREPEIKLTVDHIVPLSKQGTDYIKNIQPLCNSCNSSKGNRQDEDIVRPI